MSNQELLNAVDMNGCRNNIVKLQLNDESPIDLAYTGKRFLDS